MVNETRNKYGVKIEAQKKKNLLETYIFPKCTALINHLKWYYTTI